MAVRIGPVTAPDPVVATVGSVRRCLCASPSLLDSMAPVAAPSVLGRAPIVRALGLTPTAPLSFRDEGSPLEVEAKNIRMTTNHVDDAVSSCIDGLGIGMFLSYQIQEALAAGQLRIILEAFEPDPLPVSLVYSPTKRISARTRAFIAWAKRHLGKRLSEPLPPITRRRKSR